MKTKIAKISLLTILFAFPFLSNHNPNKNHAIPSQTSKTIECTIKEDNLRDLFCSRKETPLDNFLNIETKKIVQYRILTTKSGKKYIAPSDLNSKKGLIKLKYIPDNSITNNEILENYYPGLYKLGFRSRDKPQFISDFEGFSFD